MWCNYRKLRVENQQLSGEQCYSSGRNNNLPNSSATAPVIQAPSPDIINHQQPTLSPHNLPSLYLGELIHYLPIVSDLPSHLPPWPIHSSPSIPTCRSRRTSSTSRIHRVPLQCDKPLSRGSKMLSPNIKWRLSTDTSHTLQKES